MVLCLFLLTSFSAFAADKAKPVTDFDEGQQTWVKVFGNKALAPISALYERREETPISISEARVMVQKSLKGHLDFLLGELAKHPKLAVKAFEILKSSGILELALKYINNESVAHEIRKFTAIVEGYKEDVGAVWSGAPSFQGLKVEKSIEAKNAEATYAKYFKLAPNPAEFHDAVLNVGELFMPLLNLEEDGAGEG